MINDGIADELKNSSKLKPKSLKGKLVLGTINRNTLWSVPMKIGNLNIYSSLLPIEDMKSITNGTRCGEDGDYLGWTQSKWTLEGEITKVTEIQKSELCKMKQSTRYVHGLQTNEELRQTCTKLGNSVMHMPKNLNESLEVFDFFKESANMNLL